MRRVGLAFLAVGLAGFLAGSARHASFPEAWETVRWMFVGVAVMGVVFTALPGKPERS